MAQPVTTVPIPRRDSCYGLDGIYYPAEEEREVPLTTQALRLILYLYTAFRQLFSGRPDVFVGADQFIYYVQGDPKRKIAPDAYVIFGVPSDPYRPVIRVWEEGAAPAIVVEVSSEDSRGEDRGRKKRICQDILRCDEYLVFDDDSSEILLFRLVEGVYQLQPPDERGLCHSRVLNAWFGPDPTIRMRIYDADLRPISDPEENEENRKHLEAIHRRLEAEYVDVLERLEESERRAAEAEAENERLRAELGRLRGIDNPQR